MITIKRKDLRYSHDGLEFYWRGKWAMMITPYRYISISLGETKDGRHKNLSFLFGNGARSCYKNIFIPDLGLVQLEPTRGDWYVGVSWREFRYWQPLAIIREIIKVVREPV